MDMHTRHVHFAQVPRRDGHVYILKHLRSRRPPAVDPSWRTTYRLSCPALVAVGVLHVAHAPLEPSTRIHWAEVVPCDTTPGAYEDASRRNGRMALRLLGRADVSALPPSADLDVGARVFVIDLRVFAPEVRVATIRSHRACGASGV